MKKIALVLLALLVLLSGCSLIKNSGEETLKTGDPLIDGAVAIALDILHKAKKDGSFVAGSSYPLPWLRDIYEGGLFPNIDQELFDLYLEGIDFWAEKQGENPVYLWGDADSDRLEEGQISTNRLSGDFDESLIFISAVLDAYQKTSDKKFLSYLKNCEDAWEFGRRSVPPGYHLIYAQPLIASDWADQIGRKGFSTDLEALWYKATKDLAELEKIAGFNEKAEYFSIYAEAIKEEINRELFVVSVPNSRNAPEVAEPFGHYLAWKYEDYTADYFEVDSNFRCILYGIAEDRQIASIIEFTKENFDYLLGGQDSLPPPAKVVYGDYDPKDYASIHSNMADGRYHNQYWVNVGSLVARAFFKMGDFTSAIRVLKSMAAAFIEGEKEGSGISEWYRNDGKGDGSSWFQWSARTFLIAVYEMRDIIKSGY